MKIEPKHEYICDLVVNMGLFGKHGVQAVVDVDTPTSFHGYGRLTGESFKILGFEIDSNMQMVFENGVIDGDTLTFSVSEGSLSATFTTQVAEDGSITGKAEAAGLLRMDLSGTVSSVKAL